jgi:hypothetical protein
MRHARDSIREGLTRVWDSGGREFVTFELMRDPAAGTADPDLWAQWLEGELNLRWPRDDDPRTALPRLGVPLPAGAFISFHTPGETVIVNALDARIDDVAGFLARWFECVFDAPPRFGVAVRVDRS